MNSLDSGWNMRQYELRSEELNAMLLSNTDWSSIPTINVEPLHSIPNGSLVRFKGMVQDELPKEYYYPKFRVKNKTTGALKAYSGHLKDVLDFSENDEILIDESFGHEARNVHFCVPVPGANIWIREPSKTPDVSSVEESLTGVKRPHEEEGGGGMQVNDKILKTGVENKPKEAASLNFDHYFPLPERGGVACIVKHMAKELLVNTRVEVVGFLSVSPALEAAWEGSSVEDKAHNPPPSLVPRIHAIRIRKLKHLNPMLALTPGIGGLNYQEIRSDLHTVLTLLLFGDTLAADYLICNLLSTVYVRQDSMAIGSFTLNISLGQSLSNYPQMLFKVLQNLLPSNSYLPLTLDLLNTAAFVPRKDYETNRLWSGRLQLPDDTHLLIDETVMAAGNLAPPGLRNVVAIRSLCQHQKIPYNFTFYQIEFNTNIPVLILSEGESMIFKDAVLKLLPAEGTESLIAETFEAANFFLSGERLEAVRKYLTLARLRQCNMNNTQFVGSELANIRKDYAGLQQEDIHRMLVLSRILAISEGKNAVNRSDWDRAAIMERERRSRLRPPTEA